MKKILNILSVAAVLSVTTVPFVLAQNVQNNNTETTGQYVNSSVVTAKVKSALLAQKNIDSSTINVQSETVTNNKIIVILTGTQKNETQIELAVLTAKNVKGVSKVINKLTVSQ